MKTETRERLGVNGPVTEYCFVLGVPQEIDRDLLFSPMELFKVPSQEAAVIAFYRDNPLRIPLGVNTFGQVKVVEGEYYSRGRSQNHRNCETNKRLNVQLWYPFKEKEHFPMATRRLLGIVDEDISISEKGIVRDIAIASYQSMLRFATTPAGTKITLGDCINTRDHDWVVQQLMNYGFRIKTLEHFEDMELRR